MTKKPMTSKGADRLREQLQKLKSTDRPQVIQAIAEARAHGDLSENAEYHAAREQQSFIEGRIKILEAALANAEIIDVRTLGDTGKIVFGATVVLLNLTTDAEVCYQIVGEAEADIEQNLISVTSPISRALIGKSVDDEVTVRAPGGDVDYKIVEIRYE